MTWFESAANQTAATAAHAEVVTFVELDFPEGFIRVHTRIGTITWGGYDWLGLGQLGSVEMVREDSEIRPNGVKLTLTGVDSALVTSAIQSQYHGRAVTIYVGLMATDTLALGATPETVFRGMMDYMTIELAKDSGRITVNCESELARWNRPRGLAYTHESQQLIYPGDTGFDMVPTIQTRVLDWTKKTSFGVAPKW